MLLSRCVSDRLDAATVRNLNVFVLSVGIFCCAGSFFTVSNLQTVIMENAKDPNSTGYEEDFDGDGYIASALVNGVAMVFDFVTPAVIALLGLRLSLFLGWGSYAFFISTFYVLSTGLLYAASVVWGVGNAIVSVSGATALSLNSVPDTVNRNSGVYQFVYFGSGLVGSVYWYLQFRDTDEIHPDDRELFVTIFLVLCSVGASFYLLMLPIPRAEGEGEEEEKEEKVKVEGPLTLLRTTLRLLVTPQFLPLFFLFFYDGLSVTFWAGVYGPSLSFSTSFETDADSLAGLHGIMVHVGCMLGGAAMATTGHLQLSVRRYAIVFAAFGCNVASYVLIILNVPADAPLGVTEEEAFISPSSTGMAMCASFLLGFATGLLETQALALLASVYAGGAASHAFALQKVTYHLSRGTSFAYAGYLNLYWQLGILFMTGVLGVTGFTMVDVAHRKVEAEAEQQKHIGSKDVPEKRRDV